MLTVLLDSELTATWAEQSANAMRLAKKLREDDGGGGRMTQRVALRPSGRCLRQRFLAIARIEP